MFTISNQLATVANVDCELQDSGTRVGFDIWFEKSGLLRFNMSKEVAQEMYVELGRVLHAE